MPATKTKDLITAARGTMNPWNREHRIDMSEHQALVDQVNAEAIENWDDDSWHRQIAADISSAVDYQFTYENVFQDYFRVQTVGEFDRVRIRERRGLKVFYTSRGGYIEESQIRTEDWALPRDTLGFHVSEHTDKLRANFAVAMNDIVTLGQERLEAEVNRRIFSLLQQAVPSGSPNYVATNGLTKPELNSAIREVKDAIKPNGLGPVPVTVIGRASMIDQISDFDLGFDPEATAEVRARGRLGVYRGATVQQVINYADEDGLSYIPANELWVFGGDVGRFAMYGGLITRTWQENVVDYTHYRARKDVGGLVHHPEQSRRIVDNSVSP
jgi:hypothetical protein